MNLSELRLRRKVRTHVLTEINVVNLVDVMLTLLVIFIMISPAIQQGLKITLPEATSSEKVKQKSASIQITEESAIYFTQKGGPRRVDIPTLRLDLEAMYQADSEMGVIISADKSVSYGTVIEVLDAIRSTKIERVGMITRDISERELK